MTSILTILSIILIVRSFRFEIKVINQKISIIKVIVVIAVFFMWIYFLERVGFVITSLISFNLIVLINSGLNIPIKRIVLYMILGSIFIFLLYFGFKNLLLVPLPEGLWLRDLYNLFKLMIKILVTEFINKKSLSRLKSKFKVHYNENLWKNSKEIINIINDYDCLIVRNKTQVNKKLLNYAKKLKYIGRLGVGLDNIDTKYCLQKKINVQPATGMNAQSVAEYVALCSMSLIKNIPLLHYGTSKGRWPRTTIKSKEIKEKTLGIIGFGSIGKKFLNIVHQLVKYISL